MGKIFTVVLPDIGEGVVEGEVIEWLKQVGDPVTQDEPVVIVMTDKATVELPAPYPGKIAKQYFRPGQIAIKDKPLYDIETSAESKIPTEKEVEKSLSSPSAKSPHKQEKTTISESNRYKSGEILATPPVRHLAKQMGISLQEIEGTGNEGRILAEDLKRHQSTTTKSHTIHALPGDEEVPIIGIRHLMAKKMAESKSHIPHFSYFEQVEASHIRQLKSNLSSEKKNLPITYMPFFIKALSQSIKIYPDLNSSYDESRNTLIVHKQHNIGIAIASKLGLIVPTLKNVQEMTLEKIIHAYDDLIQRAKAGKLIPEEMKHSTITISNFGGLGGAGTWATPIINYPEVAILAIGRIQKQPVVKNDTVVALEMLNLSWSFDHRVIDGNMAVHISHEFCKLIANPIVLLEH